MSTRTRSTWAADKNAGQAPAVPGYGTEDQDHPAHQAEPDYAKYKKGDPDAWAETPNPPPYPEGNPPSVPGYDTEDQDHPAHKRPPRVEKIKLSSMVEKRAKKVLVIASRLLGAEATREAIELQALDMMDWDDGQIENTLGRLGGGFLSMDEEVFDDEPMLGGFENFGDDGMDDEEVMGCGGMMELDDMDGLEGPMAMFASALKAIATDVAAMKQANQNVYPGPTLGGPAKTEEAVRAEAGSMAKGEVHASTFDSMDTDRDGFVLASEFQGSKAVFAAIDVDADGIIAKAEYLAAFTPVASDDDDDDEDEGDDELMAKKKAETAMLDVMASLGEEEIDLLKAASDDDDDDDDDEEMLAKKKARLDALRSAGEIPEAFKKNIEKMKAKGDKGDDKDDKKPDFLKEKGDEKESGKKAKDDEEDDDAEKEASFFSTGGDPMGLGGDPAAGLHMTAEDEAVLNEIFSGDLPTTASALPGDAVEAAMNPQPKQAASGSTAAVGNMTRTASDGIEKLSDLWESAPDVSKVFG
jgi:hypothetical protein